MGRIFVDEALIKSGIDRNNLVLMATYLVRTKQAKDSADAIRKIEEGEFTKENLKEELIESNRKVFEPTVDIDIDEDI